MSLRIKGAVDLDGSGWEAGLKKIEHSADHMAEHVSSHLKGMLIAAFGTAAIEQAAHRTIEYGEKVVDTARRVGIGIEALQEFGFAARQNGSDLEALTGFIERLNAARIDPKKAGFFQQLGISESDLRSMKVEDMMMKLSENVRGRSSQEVIGPLRQIGGRGAGEMLPMLKDDLEELRQKAQEVGAVMKNDTAVKIKYLGDQLKLLGQIITVSIGPAIVWLMTTGLRFVNELKADKSFYQSLGKRESGLEKLAILAQFTPFADIAKSAFQTFTGRNLMGKLVNDMIAAGGESKGVRADAGRDLESQLAALGRKQKEIEDINSHPDFEDLFGTSAKSKTSRRLKEDGSDSLIKVGNFLGAGRGVIEDIQKQQLDVLRMIEKNTKAIGGGGSGDLGIPPV